jgi:tetratricopeptide (TPR) repeat protein
VRNGAHAEPEVLANRYELLEEAGRGAMGVVYRALDRESGRTVALKALHGADPDDLYRLKNEFRALAGVVHPHLVRLYEMSVEGDRGFFTMEFIEGGSTLVEYLRGQATPEPAQREAFRQLATALAALHGAGWIHRDLKPSNVLVDATGRVVLLDFGLIRGLGSDLAERTQAGAVVGTLAYMSPEQALGRPLSAASDWYSFGVLLYECLTGRSPFAGTPPTVLLDRTRFAIPSAALVAPDCAPDLAELASALLANDPVRRPDAHKVLAALSGGGVTVPSATVSRSAPFVGRARELARLRQAWSALRAGVAAVATVEGSSGLGKTSLVERFVEDLPAQGALVLRARCYPYELVPFEALDEVVDDLSRYLSSLSPERLDALLPRDTGALRRVFPVLGRVSLPAPPALAEDSGAEPHELRRRGFAALRDLLGRLADRRQLVIWIDDLQWADADSGPLLRELLRSPDPPPILWLLSFRAEDRGQSPLLQDLDRLLEAVPHERRQAIALAPLSHEESDELVGLLAESALSAETVRSLAQEAHGSPFLLTELLKRDGRETADTHTGVDLDGMIRNRLASLPAGARRLLESLAVTAGPLERGVALEAAGLDVSDPDLAALLESARLLRAAASVGRARLEIYHDQIRETIDRQLSADDRHERHAGIASALERRGSQDLALLFTHHAGAGHRARAAQLALLAAGPAEQQLAFDQAAHFYRAALEMDRASVDAARTLAQLAEALANAGRGPQAAEAFEFAAVEAPADVAETLRQRAAEQYLVCGRIADGKRVLTPLLASHGVTYPVTTGGAIAATLARLPRLALRYFMGAGATAPPSPEQALRIDACHRAARGLFMVDPLRGAYFSVRSLDEALTSGDGFRVGRALCLAVGTFAPLGGPTGAWARSMVARAERLAAEVRDPRLDGMVSAANAQVEFVAGRFATMLELCDRSARVLVDGCRGVRWDCDVARMGALRALEELGRIEELRSRLPALIEEAVSLDDLYAEVTFLLYEGFWRISRGETEQARSTARAVVERWGGASYQLQHLYALRIEALCDVYEDTPRAAWGRVQQAWPALSRSGLLSHRMLKSDALMLRVRVALAAGVDAEREVERAARSLERMRRDDSIATACLMRAALLARSGNRSRALELLEQAEASYASASMSLHIAYARRRRGELVGGAEGDALVWEADRSLESAGIRDPARWVEVQAPGFPSEPR